MSFNPDDRQGVRFCWGDVRHGWSWAETQHHAPASRSFKFGVQIHQALLLMPHRTGSPSEPVRRLQPLERRQRHLQLAPTIA